MPISRLYCSPFMKDLHNCDARQDYVSSENLKIKAVPNGFIFPLTEAKYGARFGGVTNHDYTFVRESLPARSHPWYMEKTPVKEQYSGRDFDCHDIKSFHMDEDVVFAGQLHNHLGHFMTEGLSRLWALLNPEFKYSKVVFIATEPSKFAVQALRMFAEKLQINFDNFIFVVRAPIKFRTIYIPEPSIRMHDFCHENYKHVVDIFKSSVEPGEYKKIYLSKVGSTSQRAGGEQLFIELFADNGYKPIALNDLQPNELFSLMKGCNSLVATSGTASHQSIFMEDNQHCVCLNRSAHVHPLQTMINRVRGHKEEYIDVFLRSTKEHFGDQPCFIFPTKQLYQYFQENSFSIDLQAVAKNALLKRTLESEERLFNWLHRTGTITFEDTLRKNNLAFTYK